MIVVIGATGFIGMYTVEHLIQSGKQVVATGRNLQLGNALKEMGAQFLQLDITQPGDFDNLPTNDVEGVKVLAGLLPANAQADLENEENAADYFEINVIGLINILEW